jgi:hypothetical protein
MSGIFHFPENDPGGVGVPDYRAGAFPPGSLIGKQYWVLFLTPQTYRIRHVFRRFSLTIRALLSVL